MLLFHLHRPEQNRRLELLRLFVDFLVAIRSNRACHGQEIRETPP
jgi:hypothetical protein